MERWRWTCIVVLGMLCLGVSHANADAMREDWFGAWAMNHDGHVGTLTIGDTKADCASTPWCDMSVRYVDSDGKTVRGTINRIDDHLQHMLFTVHFPGNEQRFDAFIFSWDKAKLAGLTYWGGRRFGFYAIKN